VGLEDVLGGLEPGVLRVAALHGGDELHVLPRLERLLGGLRAGVVERQRLEALEVGHLAGVHALAGLDAQLPERRAVLRRRLADEDQAVHLRLDGVVAGADGRELAHDRDALLDGLAHGRDDGVAVVGLDDEGLELARRDRVLDLRDLRRRVEVRVEELDLDVLLGGLLLDAGVGRLGERVRAGEAEERDLLDLLGRRLAATAAAGSAGSSSDPQAANVSAMSAAAAVAVHRALTVSLLRGEGRRSRRHLA
jgi:hypothetical protein